MKNEPRWDCEDAPDMGVSWLDVILLELALVQWPHVLAAAMAGFALGLLTFWWLT